MAAPAVHKPTESGGTFAPRRTLGALCKAAADPLRRDILRVLRQDSFGVQELASIFAVPQPGMSHHLKILSTSGLLATRREGNSIFYRRTLLRGNSELDQFQLSLFAAIDAAPVSDEIGATIAKVYKERSTQSREYFERHADKFSENQGMLCDLGQYGANVNELLDLTGLKQGLVMEVGPGNGQLLCELARRFSSVVALDSSAEMLELAKKGLRGKQSKVEFTRCSLESYPTERTFDLVVLNMVLHHMPSPAAAFQKLGGLVKSRGFVLLADLCSHNQEWARESCGDVWLGFDPEDVTDWAENAGFEEAQSAYLGLKNGFQIQLKLFRKT